MIFDTVFRYLSIFPCCIGYLLMPPLLPIICHHCVRYFLKVNEIVKCLASILVLKNVGELASESVGWVGETVTYQ